MPKQPVTFTIDQSRIVAPDFPRSIFWWLGYLPSTWMTVANGPAGAVHVTVHGAERARAAHRHLFTSGDSRMSMAFTQHDGPAPAPDAPSSTDMAWCWSSSEDCRGHIHTIQVQYAFQPGHPLNNPDAARIHTCSRHRLEALDKAAKAGRTLREVKTGNICVHSRPVAGRAATAVGPCAELHTVRVVAGTEDSPAPKRVYVCDTHATPGDSVTLPDGHPVLVLRVIEDAARKVDWQKPDKTAVRLFTAKRQAHGLPNTAGWPLVHQREGYDGRLTYLHALPYVREYATLVDQPSASPADQAALPFRPAVDKAAAITLDITNLIGEVADLLADEDGDA